MNAKIKILICGILPPPVFGHSMTYQVLMNSDFVRRFDVSFLNMRFWSYQKHKKVTVTKLLQMVKYWFQFVGLILTRQPRYVLYNISFDRMPLLKDFLFCLTGWAMGLRVVLHDHGQYVRELYDSSNGFTRFLVRRMFRMTTAAIILGEGIRCRYDGFLDQHKVFAVHPGVQDTGSLEEPAQRPQQRLTEKRPLRVLYFSFVSQSKGIWTALNAVIPVIRQNPDIVFDFAGPMESPALESDIDHFVKENHLQDRVRFMGYVGDEKERTRLFRDADIFVFPTLREAFGLVLLHALAEGVPVVASREGAIPEIIEEGTNGLLFAKGNSQELAEKIMLLARDRAGREKMKDANRNKYLHYYTPAHYASRIVEAFLAIDNMVLSRRQGQKCLGGLLGGWGFYWLGVTLAYLLWRVIIILKT